MLVERDRDAARSACATTAARLQGGDAAQVVQADALAWLARAAASAASTWPSSIRRSTPDLWDGVLPALAAAGWRADAWLYVESPRERDVRAARRTGRLHREGRTREVRYALYRAPRPAAGRCYTGRRPRLRGRNRTE